MLKNKHIATCTLTNYWLCISHHDWSIVPTATVLACTAHKASQWQSNHQGPASLRTGMCNWLLPPCDICLLPTKSNVWQVYKQEMDTCVLLQINNILTMATSAQLWGSRNLLFVSSNSNCNQRKNIYIVTDRHCWPSKIKVFQICFSFGSSGCVREWKVTPVNPILLNCCEISYWMQTAVDSKSVQLIMSTNGSHSGRIQSGGEEE